MIGRLRKLLLGREANSDPTSSTSSLELAVAVLLVELARADHQHDEREDREILQQLQRSLELGPEPARELLDTAKYTVEHSVSLHEFTRTLHEGMDYGEKQRVIEMLWQIALADRTIDKYEDYMIGKIAELLYVSRGDVIRLKHRVLERITNLDQPAANTAGHRDP